MWQHLRLTAIKKGDLFDPPYDEERLECPCKLPSRWTSIFSWLPRLKTAAVYLLLADLVIFGIVLHAFSPLITLLVRNEELFGARFIPDTKTPAATGHDNEHKIPRILHQTSANETVPAKWTKSQQSCKDVYSDFEYMYWTDKSARDFLAAEYPWFLDTWDNYNFPIQRADSIRYFVLYHYGGIYLDMDIFCNNTFPLDQIEAVPARHYALFESTLPTGVTNDFMISSAKHPAFADAIYRLPFFLTITKYWASLIPYGAIMIAAGPFFISWAVKDYLLQLPSLPTPSIQVIHSTQLTHYITDLESCTWHRKDAGILMWIGDRPWTWFAMGGIGLVLGLSIINHCLLKIFQSAPRRPSNSTQNIKMAKLT